MSAQLIDQSDDAMDPANLSVGHSEVSLSGLDIDEIGSRGSTEERHVPHATSTPPTSSPLRSTFSDPQKAGSSQPFDNLIDLDSPPPSGPFGSFRSNSPRVGSPALGHASRSGSPLLTRSASPLLNGLPKSASQTSLHSPSSSLNGRSPRVSREDVHRKLLTRRSTESPLRESVDSMGRRASTEEPEEHRGSASRALPRPLARDNPTYDGVMSVDPEPQPIDPPRPSLGLRAHSVDGMMPEFHAKEAFKGLDVDFTSGFDVGGIGADAGDGLGMSLGETPLGDMRSALDRLMEDVAGEASTGPSEMNGMGLKIEAVTAGIQAGQYQIPADVPDSDREHSREVSVHDDMDIDDAAAPHVPDFRRPTSPPVVPPPPTKDARRAREELVLRKKREARQREEEEDLGLRTPPRGLGIGRPSRRRSRSTSDADPAFGRKSRGRPSSSTGGLLDDVPVEEEDPLADSIDRELRKIGTPGSTSVSQSSINALRSSV